MYCDGLFSGGIMQQLQFDHFPFDEAAMARIKVVQCRMRTCMYCYLSSSDLAISVCQKIFLVCCLGLHREWWLLYYMFFSGKFWVSIELRTYCAASGCRGGLGWRVVQANWVLIEASISHGVIFFFF